MRRRSLLMLALPVLIAACLELAPDDEEPLEEDVAGGAQAAAEAPEGGAPAVEAAALPAAPPTLLASLERPVDPVAERLEGDALESWRRIEAATGAAAPAVGWAAAPSDVPAQGRPWLRSRAWYVVDEDSGEVLTAHRAEQVRPIASISKLAAMLVWADAGLPLDSPVTIDSVDKHHLRQVTKSRLRVGGSYRTVDLLHSALLASDNRATTALARATGLTLADFTEAMNRRVRALGLETASFGDPTGLDPQDVASARDVARLLHAAVQVPLLRQVLTTRERRFRRLDRPASLLARATNHLAHMDHWRVGAAKTGSTYAAGYCLVTQAEVAGRNLVMAFLGARGKDSRYGDAGRIRAWIEKNVPPPAAPELLAGAGEGEDGQAAGAELR